MSLHHLRHPIPLFITLIVLAVQILTPLAVAAERVLQPAGAVAPALGVIRLGARDRTKAGMRTLPAWPRPTRSASRPPRSRR